MELMMATIVALLFAGGTYMILRPNFIRIVMGLGLYSNGANLLLITSGGYARANDAPFVAEGQTQFSAMMDPLPPDIILTAIVISFAVGALLLTISYRVYLDHGTDNPEQLPNLDEDEGDQKLQHLTPVPNVFEELSRQCADAPRENVSGLPVRTAHG